MLNARWFDVWEFRCHDGTDVPAQLVDTNFAALVSQLDVLRDDLGGPIEVVSGYRTPSYNHAIGGAAESQHMRALAADVRPVIIREGHRVRWDFLHKTERLDVIKRFLERVERLLEAQRLPLVGGLGLYPGKWLHIDVRPRPSDGHIARWFGTGIGSEMA